MIRADEPLIFDVGAHHGSVARTYLRLFPGALIHCFEPFPDSFNILSENLKGDSRIHCHQTALSDVAGLAVLNANLSSQTNSLLPTDPSGAVIWGGGLLDTTGKVEVAVATVDHFVRDNKIAHIDILKLDVQGAEYAVFQGATETLRQQKVSAIYTELILGRTYEGQHKLHEYLQLLAAFGYQLLDFFNPIRHRHQLIQADFIFLPA